MTKTSYSAELTFLIKCFAIHEFLGGGLCSRIRKAVFYNEFIVLAKASKSLLCELKMMPSFQPRQIWYMTSELLASPSCNSCIYPPLGTWWIYPSGKPHALMAEAVVLPLGGCRQPSPVGWWRIRSIPTTWLGKCMFWHKMWEVLEGKSLMTDSSRQERSWKQAACTSNQFLLIVLWPYPKATVKNIAQVLQITFPPVQFMSCSLCTSELCV